MNIRDFLISLQSEQAPIVTDLVKLGYFRNGTIRIQQ